MEQDCLLKKFTVGYKKDKFTPEPGTLGTLEVGDFFELENDKKKVKDQWLVRGNPFYNAGAFAHTRYCTLRGSFYGKLCFNKVTKVGESKHKEKYKLKPIQHTTKS